MVLKRREKIIVLVGILVMAAWAFDWFYYAPQKKKIGELQAAVKAAEFKLNEGRTFRRGVEKVEAEIFRLDKELQGYHKRILRGEEFRTFLKQLAQDSDRLPMKLISLTPLEEKTTRPSGKQEHYKRVLVQMVLQTTYAALGNYLQGIDQLPFLVTVDHVRIERKEELSPYLRVTLELSVRILAAE